MIWHDHWKLKGKHAYLGASKWNWINYDEDHLVQSYSNFEAIQRGTELHALAEMCIRNHVNLRGNKTTLAMYVNDAIGYRMTPEQILYYSDNCFGTTDSICFRDNLLRIHDLKTGATPAHMEQLMIYEAVFCLEYGHDPSDIDSELRIYQNDAITACNPEADDIHDIMDKIVRFDTIISHTKAAESEA